MDYKEYLKSKVLRDVPTGIKDISQIELNNNLFDYQKDIVKWSLKRGRSCVWASCGCGKTNIELEWSKHVNKYTNKPVLIFAPLAVSEQTAKDEAPKFGYDVKIVSEQNEIINGINITNYEKMEKFDFSNIGGIVLDESSILKSVSGKTRNFMLEKCVNIPFRLACSATPAPNDFMELGNHAEFVGAMKYNEMLSMFFVHDGGETQKWRLKGHARGEFFKWIASWAVIMRKPSDLGYSDDNFILPKLNIHEVIVKTEAIGDYLIPMVASTLQDRQEARRCTIKERAQVANEIIDKYKNEENKSWFVWCNLNIEADTLRDLRKDKGMINIQGSDDNEYKSTQLLKFEHGEIDEVVSKPKIAGFGLNLQVCHNTIFLGLSDSYEQYYQAVRRFWRFGQKHEVNVYIVTADTEGSVVENIKRKEKDSDVLYEEMVKYMSEINKAEVHGIEKDVTNYVPDQKIKMPMFFKK